MAEDWHARVYASGDGAAPRKSPKMKMRKQVLAEQGGRCIYCGNEFGTAVIRDGQITVLKVHWDHYVPYAFQGANQGFVAACNVCNLLKHAHMYTSLDEARRAILARWESKGYQLFQQGR